jgi:hypothetical protein
MNPYRWEKLLWKFEDLPDELDTYYQEVSPDEPASDAPEVVTERPAMCRTQLHTQALSPGQIEVIGQWFLEGANMGPEQKADFA